MTSTVMPAANIPLNRHLSIGMSPIVGFGSGGTSIGLSASLNANFDDWNISFSAGGAGNYSAWHGSATWKGFGAGYGQTFYAPSMFHNQTICSQTVGTLTGYFQKFNLMFSNDAIGDTEDRWRTSAVELSYGNMSIGTYVDTNWGYSDSGNEAITDPNLSSAPKPVKSNRNGNGAWKNGKAFYAPIWIGIRKQNMITQLGYSHVQVQNLTQNLIHKYPGNTHFFIDYSMFKSGAYIQTGTVSPFSAWMY